MFPPHSQEDRLMKAKNLIYYMNESCAWFGSVLFIAVTFVCFLQVVLRYFLNAAQDWPEEASRFLFIWIAYLGMAFGVYAKKHLKVDMVYILLDPKRQKWLDIVGQIMTLGFMLVVAWQGLGMLEVVIESEEVALTLPISLWLIWLAIPFCFLVSAVNCVSDIIAALRTGKEENQ